LTQYNIVIVTIADLPEGGGNTSRLKTLVDALIQAGNKVTILNQHALGITPESVQKSEGQISGAPYYYVLNTTKRTSGFASIGIKIRAVIAIAKKLIEYHKKKEIDVLWFNHLSFYDVYPLTLLARYLNIPTIQSYEDERLERVSSEKISISTRIFAVNSALGDQYCPQLADGIVVISNYLKSKYDKLSKDPDKVYIVPTIIDCEQWGCSEEEDTAFPTILYAGAFNEQDEIENLIEAFAVLISKGYDFRVVMLGGNERHSDRMAKVYEQIDRLGLSSIVDIKGFVPLAEVKAQVCKSNILINIRRDGVYSRSGLSTKLSEYLASGRMVISSDLGDVSQYLSNGKSALLVPSTVTVDEIYQALSQGLQSIDLRRKIGAAGRDVAKRYFDVSVAKVKLQAILDKVLTERK
jgi:glycosyltransferase involved in cell wall biosynthesis